MYKILSVRFNAQFDGEQKKVEDDGYGADGEGQPDDSPVSNDGVGSRLRLHEEPNRFVQHEADANCDDHMENGQHRTLYFIINIIITIIVINQSTKY